MMKLQVPVNQSVKSDKIRKVKSVKSDKIREVTVSCVWCAVRLLGINIVLLLIRLPFL